MQNVVNTCMYYVHNIIFVKLYSEPDQDTDNITDKLKSEASRFG
jgi:hypothetical protein